MTVTYIIARNIFLAGTLIGGISVSKAQKITLSNVSHEVISETPSSYGASDQPTCINPNNITALGSRHYFFFTGDHISRQIILEKGNDITINQKNRDGSIDILLRSGATSLDMLSDFHDNDGINYNTGNSDITNQYQFLKVMVTKGILKMEDWTERSAPTNRGR